jgi:hypothetical protein
MEPLAAIKGRSDIPFGELRDHPPRSDFRGSRKGWHVFRAALCHSATVAERQRAASCPFGRGYRSPANSSVYELTCTPVRHHWDWLGHSRYRDGPNTFAPDFFAWPEEIALALLLSLIGGLAAAWNQPDAGRGTAHKIPIM